MRLSPLTAPLVLLALTGFAACRDAVQAAGDPVPPNIVIVALDTLRPDHMGCYGYERDTTPVLDALAERSVFFANAQSTAPWTAPSLISLMTSLYPETHGVTGHPELTRLSERAVTLAEVLRARGYATGAFTEGGFAKGAFGLDQGFDVYPSNPGDETSNSSNRVYPSRIASNVDRSLAWLAERGDDEPFLLFFQTYEPHTPLRVDEEFVRVYRPDYDEAADHERIAHAIERWNAEGVIEDAELAVLQRHFFHCEFSGAPVIEGAAELVEYAAGRGVPINKRGAARFPEAVAWLRDFYDAAIAHTDAELARLLAALEGRGALENTIIVVVSDHGEGLGQHGKLGHGSLLHEELLHVALFMYVPPQLGAATRVEGLVSLVDVMPTLLELVGAGDGGGGLQGRSLVRLFVDGGGGDGRERFTLSHASRAFPESHGIRTQRWRLIVDEASGAARLFDRENDPLEVADVAAAHPEVVAELEEQLRLSRAENRARRRALEGAVESAVIDAATRRDLEALGYVGGEEE